MRILKSHSKKARKPRRTRGGLGLTLEVLEDRLAPALTWTGLGPAPLPNGQTAPDPNGLAVSGRVTGIAADATDANTLYLASAGGGVWKTSNGGTSWSPLTDNLLSTNGMPLPVFMGAIAETRDGSNNQIVYAGMGEANNGGDNFYGDGILVSRNGGTTWTLTTAGGAFIRQAVSKIAIDPSDPTGATAYAALSPFPANAGTRNAGIWKTTNFGATWTNTTAGLANTPTQQVWSDVVVDPNSPSTVYAAEGTSQTGGGLGAGNGVYKSTNGGTNWSQLTGSGSFNGTQDGRIALALFNNGTTQKLFVSIAVPSNQVNGGALFKMLESTDGGSTFADLTANLTNYMGGQGWYDTTLAVDPANANYVYAAGAENNQGPTFSGSPVESFDGGSTWHDIATDPANNGPHSDAHAVAFDAAGNLLDGNDGGIFKLSNPTNSTTQRWSSLNTNLNTIQFYGIAVDPTNANIAYGGSQDNGTEKFTAGSGWNRIQSGDGAVTLVDPTNHNRVYSEFNGASLQRSDDGGTNFTDVSSGIRGGSGGNFYNPYALDSAGDIFYGTNQLNFSSNQGSSWTTIAQGGVSGFNTNGQPIDAVAVSPTNGNIVYVAARGKLFVTQNALAGGTNVTWTEIDLPNGVLSGNALNSLTVSPSGSAVEVINSFTGGGKHVFFTTTFGGTWTDISGNLPDTPVWSVAFSSNGQAVYVGTDIGVYSTTNGGTTWSVFGTGLPNAQVDDLKYVGSLNLLAAGTHGRGLWEISIPLPTANNQSVTVPENTPTQITLTGSAPGGDAFTFQIAANPGQGTLSNLNAATGTVTYTPNTGFTGADSFTFTVTDTVTGLVSAAATVSITVTGGFTFTWTGGTSSDWFTAANWTDASNINHHAVPTGADTAAIVSALNNPILTANATVAGLQLNGGTLTLNANLTDTGDLAQDNTTVSFGADTDVLTVDGNFTITGGAFSVAHGTVVLAGSSAQTLADNAGLSLPNLSITGSSSVTIPAGSSLAVTSLSVAKNLTLQGNLMDTGNFTQTAGTIGMNNGILLNVQGDFTSTGGFFSMTGGVGTVALSGQASHHISDTSGSALPNLKIINDNVTGIIVNTGTNLAVASFTLAAPATLVLQGNATLSVSGSFTDNGKLVLSQPTAGAAAPVTVTGTLTLASTSVFDLTVGAAAAGNSYNFVHYGTLTDNAGATFIIRGNGSLDFTVNRSATALSVALSGMDTFTWTGGTSGDWFTAANWTDAGGLHAVPGLTDSVIIRGAPFDPVLTAPATVANLRVTIGFLTLNATLTDTGTYSQDSGFVGFGADADQLIIDGNVNYIGGWLNMNGHGTVVLAGTTGQTVTDRATRALPNLVISNTSAAGVTLAAGSALSAQTLTLAAGSVLNLSVAAPGNTTAPLVVAGTMTLGAGSHLNLTMGAPASGVTYLFLQFGSLVDNGVVFGFSGQGTFTPTAHENANSLTVTLA
jgi:hypothetical protein